MNDQPERWAPSEQRTIFYVGNYGYLPNRLAVNYIVGEIAPRVLRELPDVIFRIIGTDSHQIDPTLHHPSIELLGLSTGHQVQALFVGGGLLCVPILNTFGLKFKVAEALSYGTPFIASPQTMLGLPYLSGVPTPSLEDSDTWCQEICRLMRSPNGDALKELSDKVTAQHRTFIASQDNIWSRTFFG